MAESNTAPMGQELPPPGLSIAHAELSDRLGREVAENLSLRMENRQYAERIRHLERELSEHKAARIAYASEFPLNADGEPDVGNIHANIRSLKRELKQAKLQELADTGQEIERGPVQSIGDDPKFRELVEWWAGAAHSSDKYTRTLRAKAEWSKLIAYIDGRSAGTVPEGWKLVPRAPTPEMCKAFYDHDEGGGNFLIGYGYMIAAAPTPTNSGREEANEN